MPVFIAGTATVSRRRPGPRPPASNLARLAEERGPPADSLTDDRLATAPARLALAGIHLVVQLVLARLPVEIDILLVGERRAAVLHRFLQCLDHRAIEPSDLLARERVAHAVPAQSGAEEDLVAVDVADAGEELLVHEQALELDVRRGGERGGVVRRDGGRERVDAEVGELRHFLLDAVELGDEHLAERARVDEAQLTALGERDHDVRVLRCRLARSLGPNELSGHPEVDHEDVASVEPRQDVLAAPFDPRDLLADEPVRELLPVVMPADRAHAVGVHGLDALPYDLPFEVAANDLDLRQLRHRLPPVGTLRPLS